MDDLGMNTGAGKSGKKTAMDFALDAGQCDEETVAKKFDVQAYLLEKGESVSKVVGVRVEEFAEHRAGI